jgi:hypothetical protein
MSERFELNLAGEDKAASSKPLMSIELGPPLTRIVLLNYPIEGIFELNSLSMEVHGVPFAQLVEQNSEEAYSFLSRTAPLRVSDDGQYEPCLPNFLVEPLDIRIQAFIPDVDASSPLAEPDVIFIAGFIAQPANLA